MAKNKLTDNTIKKAKYPDTKSLSDGEGLSVVLTAASKTFRFRYQRPVNKKINNLSIGKYPTTSLKKAREIAESYRQLLVEKIDPQFHSETSSMTFDDLANRYFSKKKFDWSEKHYTTQFTRYKNYLKDAIGQRDITQIKTNEVYRILDSISTHGSYQTAEKISHILTGCFDHAVMTGILDSNPALRVIGQVTNSSRKRQMPHFNLTRDGEEERFKKFLKDIYGLTRTSIQVKTALMLTPHLFTRTGNLVNLTLENYKPDEQMLIIPNTDMKRKHSDFIIPLSRQAQNLIDEMLEVTKPKHWLFKSAKYPQKHISQESLNKAKQRAGWSYEDGTIHGLRHTATTYLTEKGYDYEVTEMQLHHKLQGVRGVYNKAVHLEKRREMMQDWSDYLDELLNQ